MRRGIVLGEAVRSDRLRGGLPYMPLAISGHKSAERGHPLAPRLHLYDFWAGIAFQRPQADVSELFLPQGFLGEPDRVDSDARQILTVQVPRASGGFCLHVRRAVGAKR